MQRFTFGDFITRFERTGADDAPWGPFFRTVGYTAVYPEAGVAEVTWPDPSAYTFPGPDGRELVHGGMLATLADTAMAHAALTLLDQDHMLLTADLRVDFVRAVPVQPLIGIGRVERRTRRIYHCSGTVMDTDRATPFAESRCVQVIL